jgi:hypothetical protein
VLECTRISLPLVPNLLQCRRSLSSCAVAALDIPTAGGVPWDAVTNGCESVVERVRLVKYAHIVTYQVPDRSRVQL